MLQRIQTVFFLLCVAVSATLLFVPFLEYGTADAITKISLMPKGSGILLVPAIINVLVALFTVMVIFQYKKRVRQSKLAMLIMALNVILMGLMLLLEYVPAEMVATKKYTFGSFLPIGSVIFSYLAARFIKKDEELVRSADRIR